MFICKNSCWGFASFRVHYKIIHILKPDSAYIPNYTYLENNYFQTFNCLSLFNRHLNQKHLSNF